VVGVPEAVEHDKEKCCKDQAKDGELVGDIAVHDARADGAWVVDGRSVRFDGP
jgi:hypothetical protein